MDSLLRGCESAAADSPTCFARECGSMSNVPRGWTTDEGRRQADATRWPVLVRLPNLSADLPAERSSKLESRGGIEYRFDPPQADTLGGNTPDNVHAAVSQQPHMLERGRLKGERGFPRRE